MGHAATYMAIDLLQLPTRVRFIRAAPLPNGVLNLLYIAAGDEAATNLAAETTGRSQATVKEAAAFFIEQILLHPESDSYRVLGAQPEASASELRLNMALLLRWLHPDHDRRGEHSVFAHRVTRAWNDLKTEERRAAYDRSRRMALAKRGASQNRTRAKAKNHGSRPAQNNHAPSYYRPSRQPFGGYPQRSGLLRRMLLLLLGRAIH